MADLLFYDAAFPPLSHPANADGVAFYIGGDTPHTWSLEEIAAQKVRYRLPIYVRSDPVTANASADAAEAIVRLGMISAPRGTLVALDSETSADADYVRTFVGTLNKAGHPVIDYGSVSTVFGNDNPDGYYWGAHWTSKAHLEPGTQMTQWVATGAYDESTALATLPFWDTRPPSNSIVLIMPTIGLGATGIYVRRAQALCNAGGQSIRIDGIYGPITRQAVTDMQVAALIPQDGVVGPVTWKSLLGG